LNLPAPVEEHLEFRVEARKEKYRVKELHGIIRKLRNENSFVEQRNEKQQEKIQELKRKRKDQRAVLKEVKESNKRLYWHNVVLTTKLKHRDNYHTMKSPGNSATIFEFLEDIIKIVRLRILVNSISFKYNFFFISDEPAQQ
jgi:hypothetical protein